MWIWMAIGMSSFLVFAVAVGLARTVVVIAFDISELHEATSPP
jgi:hypothetical protein